MRYSHHSETARWQEIDGKIGLVLKVMKLAESGMTRSQVSRELKISLFRISELFGYLAFHGLLSKSISISYSFSSLPENLVAYFEALQCDLYTYPETKYKKAKAKYGWDLKTFSYYYAQSEVQLYYIHKTSDLKKALKKHQDLPDRAERSIDKLIQSDIRLSSNQVATILDCSEKTLHSHGLATAVRSAKYKQLSIKRHNEEKELRNKFDELVADHDDGELLLKRAVYRGLGRHREYISKNYPGLLNYINASVKAFNNKVHTYQFQLLKDRIQQSIQKIDGKNRKLCISAVAKDLGIKCIHVKGYRSIKETIIQEIENHRFIQ